MWTAINNLFLVWQFKTKFKNSSFSEPYFVYFKGTWMKRTTPLHSHTYTHTLSSPALQTVFKCGALLAALLEIWNQNEVHKYPWKSIMRRVKQQRNECRTKCIDSQFAWQWQNNKRWQFSHPARKCSHSYIWRDVAACIWAQPKSVTTLDLFGRHH